ncbi:MAG TPA: DUF4180 domain-containing protein [Chloroflexota bacterium]|nr:DUF4180 domain-containing protein [Chloroflexota bacterium]
MPENPMTDSLTELHGIRVLRCAEQGRTLQSERDALELIGEATQHEAAVIVIPVARLGEDFFRLSTGVAGQMIQKPVTYGLRVAIVGDISRQVGQSAAWRDLVAEANRGEQFCFVPDTGALGAWLARAPAPGAPAPRRA